jgi:hypothetical protein
VAAQFFNCLYGKCSDLDLSVNQADLPTTDQYWFGICQELAKQVGHLRIKFCVANDYKSLPVTGKDVFAMLLSDEWGHFPAYAGQVAGVFRSFSHVAINENRLGDYPFDIRMTLTRKYVRRVIRGRLGALQSSRTSKLRPNIHTLPLGYYNQGPFQQTPIMERPVDVFFAGHIEESHERAKNAKDYNRNVMGAAVAECRRTFPHLKIDSTATVGFAESTQQALTYAERLANAKVSLCPRGSQPETFRFFESFRAGCIVICEMQAPAWFNEKHPGIEVRSWLELPEVLQRIFGSGSDMVERQSESLRYWEDTVSEKAVAGYIAKEIQRKIKR